MVEPQHQLRLRSERPQICVAWWQRLLAAFNQHPNQDTRRREYDHRLECAGRMLQTALRCEDRQQLEELVGAPRYAMDGAHYVTSQGEGEGTTHPDTVEVYERDGCLVEIWFKDGAMVTGTASPSPKWFLYGCE